MATRTTLVTNSLILAATLVVGTMPVHAGVEIHTDYIAIDVEGEDLVSKDDRWVLTEPTTPTQEQDPDGNHSDTAVGNAYLELLPDIRVTHSDPFGPPTAIWGAAGTGPELSYMVDFPQAGRYYVHARANSTGSEDNGIHVGINDTWPFSGERMQWCTNGRGWQWSSRQRDSGGAGPCGASHTVWLEVPTPGVHNVKFSAREDGFELDRFILIKDLSDNTRICQPWNEGAISCNNGSLESFDDVADVGVKLESDLSEVKTDDEVTFTLIVNNEDNYDTADNVEVNIAAAIGDLWEVVSMDELCQSAGTDLNCALGSIAPSSSHDPDHRYNFTLRAIKGGNAMLNAVISTTDIDGDSANDTATASVAIEYLIPLTSMSAELIGDSSARKVAEKIVASVELTNTGDDPALAVRASVALPSGLTLDQVPDNCVGASALICQLGDVAAGESATIELAMTATADGFMQVKVAPTADNLSEGLAVLQRNFLVVKEASESEQPTEDPDAASSTWWLLSGLAVLALGRRTYKPTIARRRTA